ncbi:endonuclease/exonuclease/phosphatase family protein, partial [Faecalibacterium prausnitzii]
LALQETTPDFLKRLEEAGISQLLPYSQTSSADGYFGNALFSALPFENPSQTDVDSIASYMPGGTVGFDNGAIPVRFV